MVLHSVKARARRIIAQIARTDELEKRIRLLESAVAELSPGVVQRSPELIAKIHDFVTANDLDGLDVDISKNDLMYQYILREQGSKTAAYLWYLESGLQMCRLVEAVASANGKRLSDARSLLDFASGYGRLTRFLVQVVDPDRVWVAEIKERAVEFQKRQFRVHGFVSSVSPTEIDVDERFDLIFVASLFSHLPDETFRPWLQQLCNLLTPRGTIAFSVHGEATSGTQSVTNELPRISYQRDSEERHLVSDDEPLDVDSYGVTTVNEAYVARVVDNLEFPNRKYWRFAKGIHGRQDLYLLSRDPDADFSRFNIPSFSPRASASA